MRAGLAVVPLLFGALEASGSFLVSSTGPYELEVLVEGAARSVIEHGGQSYLEGARGERYELRIHNRSGRRVEAVLSVDGRDVIAGQPADYRRQRGYLVPAHGSVTIDGFRLSNAAVAAFRFSSVADSYAARMGDARNVGVIGVAIFPERPPLRSWAERSADAAAEAPAAAPDRRVSGGRAGQERAQLGTEFGEERSSPVEEVAFEREHPDRPACVLGLRYNDRAGLIAAGIVPARAPAWREAEPFQTRFATPPPGWKPERYQR